jgi:hypothetical protein
LYPSIKKTSKNDNLELKYEFEESIVTRRNKIGEIIRKDKIDIPQVKGFIIKITKQNGNYNGQAERPQTIKREKYNSFLGLKQNQTLHYQINIMYGNEFKHIQNIYKVINESL